MVALAVVGPIQTVEQQELVVRETLLQFLQAKATLAALQIITVTLPGLLAAVAGEALIFQAPQLAAAVVRVATCSRHAASAMR
jgi:hypothetical protein